jgi:carbonic anhydrase
MREVVVVIGAAFLMFLAQPHRSDARTWSDIPLLSDTRSIDTTTLFYLHLEELRYASEISGVASVLSPKQHLAGVDTADSAVMVRGREGEPNASTRPSPSPSGSTAPPSVNPSTQPGKKYTQPPATTSPTLLPTHAATSPPTSVPRSDLYPEVDVPAHPDPWYFNYNATSPFGPGEPALARNGQVFEVDIRNNGWGTTSRPPYDYWKEFTYDGFGPWKGLLDINKPLRNKCGTGMVQSPIDIRESGAVCHEHHQVRPLPGDFQVTGPSVDKRIEGNKLRLVYRRRPCTDLNRTECQEPDPPHADFPSGWSGFADALHIDFKVPAEHTVWNQKLDGEMQIFHIHPTRRRLAAQSVLIRATEDGYNYYLQEALNAFQKEYDHNIAKCRRRTHEESGSSVDGEHRSLTESGPFAGYANYLDWAKAQTDSETKKYWEEHGPKQFPGGVWDPYHEMLLPTIYFYRYDGSLTEPPCGEFVSWFVADKPMNISLQQLEQIKTMIFTNVDGNCQKTSVHYEESVARPIQKTNGRAVWKCTSSNFGHDTG